MKEALWIAVDLCAEAPPRGIMIMMVLLLLVFLPFQTGFVDGSLVRAGVHAVPPMRTTLAMHGAWPVLVGLMVTQNALFARRQRRELEPLLAAPVSGLQIVMGYALPLLASCIVGPLLMFPWSMLGYRILGGSFPTAPARGLGMSFLLVATAGAVMAAPGTWAALYARHGQSMLGTTALGYAALFVVDGALMALRALSLDGLVVPALLAAAGAGLLGLRVVARSLDRERLIQRV